MKKPIVTPHEKFENHWYVNNSLVAGASSPEEAIALCEAVKRSGDTPLLPTADDVRRLAGEKILSLCPEWKQRNLTARASILAAKGRGNWTAEEQAEWEAGEAIWAQIKAIRDASNVLEAMDPIPLDYDDPKWWPA